MMPANNTVACLCGKVKIHLESKPEKYTVCHCNSCQKWGGGPLFMAFCGTGVTFDRHDLIKEYHSSAWATRAFCLECGTHLFSRFIKDSSYNIPVGLLPKENSMEMSIQYFIDQKPDHYCFSNQTTTMTKEKVLTHFQ